MELKILLTSDVHLGMKFASYPEEIQKRLIDARFNTLESLIKTANENKCDLFVLAGDLFDRISVSKKDISKACSILNEFQGKLVVVMPGNHDYISLDRSELWHTFKSEINGNVLLIAESKPYPLKSYDIDACIYPGVCSSKHSKKNAIGWIKELSAKEDCTLHIGLGHGALEGFSPDFDGRYYPMSINDLDKCNMDLWLLGHTHMQYPEKPSGLDKIFYAGSPEPDGFDCRHRGKAWFLKINENKKVEPESLTTGTYWFTHDETEIISLSDFEKLIKKYKSDNYRNCLMKLSLTGRLDSEVFEEVQNYREQICEHFLYCHYNDNDLLRKITSADIEKEFAKDSFPYRLLMKLSKNEKEEDICALQEAYSILMEQKQ